MPDVLAGLLDGDERLCVECGHALIFHDDSGCFYRQAGTLRYPPVACGCARNRMELRMTQGLTKPPTDG